MGEATGCLSLSDEGEKLPFVLGGVKLNRLFFWSGDLKSADGSPKEATPLLNSNLGFTFIVFGILGTNGTNRWSSFGGSISDVPMVIWSDFCGG